MTQLTDERRRVRNLAETLALEYGGALPAGQVLAAVFRANQSLGPHPDLSQDQRLERCESLARRRLTAQLAVLRPPWETVPTVPTVRSHAVVDLSPLG